MFDLNVVIAVNNIAEAKKRFMRGGLNANVSMGYGCKTYLAAGGKKGKERKKEKKEKVEKD